MTPRQDLGLCVFCEEPAVQFHHLSGRDPDRARLDDDLGAPLCHRCHTRAHEALRAAGLDTAPDTATTPLGTVEHCLRRAASFFGQIWDRWPIPLWEYVACAVQSWAELLADQRRRLDLACPGWQHL